MKAVSIARAELTRTALDGCVLAHDVCDEPGRIILHKGRRLGEVDRQTLGGLVWKQVHVIVPEAGDLHEDAAGARIGAVACGPGTVLSTLSGGHWPVRAANRGLVRVRTDALCAVNQVEGMAVYTLFDGQVVDQGEVVARAKIVPFVIAGERIAEAERIVSGGGSGLVAVRPFTPVQVGAVVQESLGEHRTRRFREALEEKVKWFGSSLLPPRFVAPEVEGIAQALDDLVEAGAGLITLAGSRAMDPLDPAFGALERAGAAMVRHGVPAHPGSLFWLARLAGVPVLGMPSCGLFSRATVFDLVVPRLLAGEVVGAPELASLGHGGFLTRDMAFRFPPYRVQRERGEVS